MKDPHSDLRSLVEHYGKRPVNSATKYPSILTLHEISGNGVLLPSFTTDLTQDPLFATEKIDGTNVRMIFYKGQYLIGSREDMLCHMNDLYHNTALDIVDLMRGLSPLPLDKLAERIHFEYQRMIVVYGELYGGKTTANSKQYGKDANGFRVFDVAQFWDTDIAAVMSMPLDRISSWREKETDEGMKYGQDFFSVDGIKDFCQKCELEQVPMVPFSFNGMSHHEVLEAMDEALPETLSALSDSALRRPEGIVVRSPGRSKIVKLRFEDYAKTLGTRGGQKKVNRFEDRQNWPNYVGKVVTKHSGKPFKSGDVESTVVSFTTNPDTNREGFLMEDGSIVDCHQCKLA